MRTRNLITLLAVGMAARELVRRRRAGRAAARFADFARDPRDPVQNLDEPPELQVDPLALDAWPEAEAEAEADLADLEVDIDETADRDAAEISATAEVGEPARRRDAGDLYGGHTPPAGDREHPDDDEAFDTGQNWLEALETSAVESGPEPERALDDVVDDEDVLSPPHPSDTRDTPIADLGSAGRRGL